MAAGPAINGPQAPGLESALATLRSLLTSEETLEAWAAQHRLYALTHRRVCIAATSGRFISLNRRLLGGYTSADIRWQETHQRLRIRVHQGQDRLRPVKPLAE